MQPDLTDIVKQNAEQEDLIPPPTGPSPYAAPNMSSAPNLPVLVTPKRSLVRKLAEVMGALERVAKRGYNEFHKYEYVTEADLADAIRQELAKRQIIIFPNIKRCVRSPLEVETYKGIRKTQLTEIEVEWTFVDGESSEERTITVAGVGEDNVDKGFYKAFTGSEKYMLMKSFLIPTGDDPEKDSKEDAKAAKQRGKEEAQGVGQRKVAEATERGYVPLDKLSIQVLCGEKDGRLSGTGTTAIKAAIIKAGGKYNRTMDAWYVPLDRLQDAVSAARTLKMKVEEIDQHGEVLTRQSGEEA